MKKISKKEMFGETPRFFDAFTRRKASDDVNVSMMIYGCQWFFILKSCMELTAEEKGLSE